MVSAQTLQEYSAESKTAPSAHLNVQDRQLVINLSHIMQDISEPIQDL